jgi:ornithine decarboxylase
MVEVAVYSSSKKSQYVFPSNPPTTTTNSSPRDLDLFHQTSTRLVSSCATFEKYPQFSIPNHYEHDILIDSLSVTSSIPDIQENASLNNQLDDTSSTFSTTSLSSGPSDVCTQEDAIVHFAAIHPSGIVPMDDAFLDAEASTKLIYPKRAFSHLPASLIDTIHGYRDEVCISEYPRIETRPVQEIIQRHIFEDAMEDAFFVADLGAIVRQHRQWKTLLPRVEPFYAIKCNSDPTILKTLYNLGTGFDCASRAEIDAVMKLGTLPNNIIYANPCKQASHIRHARDCGVNLMTFDNANELLKIKEINPHAKMVLRLLTDDSRSMCRFGVKFGARPEATLSLLQLAKDLKLEVVGVSFHVGSGCFDKMAFVDAVKVARHVFDEGLSLGMNFTLLDIGGGFPGLGSNNKLSFSEIASVLGPVIDEYFPSHVRVIAEPGRYYASGTYTLCVNVTSRRVVPCDQTTPSPLFPEGEGGSRNDHPSYMYYVNDGVYGSFNCLVFDHAALNPKVLTHNGRLVAPDVLDSQDYFECSLWGPTCDSIDCISKKTYLPELQLGDWLYFENMGAYTIAAASTFNGFARSNVVYTNTELAH